MEKLKRQILAECWRTQGDRNHKFKSLLYTLISILIFLIGIGLFVSVLTFLFIKLSELSEITLAYRFLAVFLLVIAAVLVVSSGFLFNQGTKNRVRSTIKSIQSFDQEKDRFDITCNPATKLFFNDENELLGTNLEGEQRSNSNGDSLFIKYRGSTTKPQKISRVIYIYTDLGEIKFGFDIRDTARVTMKDPNRYVISEGEILAINQLDDENLKVSITNILTKNHIFQIKLKNPYAHPNGQAKDGIKNKVMSCLHKLTLGSAIEFNSEEYRCPIESGKPKLF